MPQDQLFDNSKNRLKSFYVLSDNTCIRLRLYAEDVRNLLIGNGWRDASRIEEAEIIFINTCSFLKDAEDRAINEIRSITTNKSKGQQVVVFGCLPSTNLKRLREVHEGPVFSGRNLDEIIAAFNLEKVETKISHRIQRRGSRFARFNKWLNRALLHDDYFTYLYDKDRAFHLKISEGCLGNCAFCSERFARGGLKSKRVADIVREFQEGLCSGYRIFSLNADDTGVFGRDNGENTVLLLEEILKEERDFKLVITEFNPSGLLRHKDRLIELLGNPKIEFITVPLQSGNERILRLMRRPYSPDDVLDILREVRKRNPKIKINTHIIVGFPGERDEEFKDTCRMLDKFRFTKVKVFEYSERPGTLASAMGGKVSEEIKKERQRHLRRKIIGRCIRRLNLKEFLLNANFHV